MTTRTKDKDNRIITMASELVGRLNIAKYLGRSYGGTRDIYSVLGYDKEIGWDDYWAQYKRQDIAKAIINRPVKMTWKGELKVLESDDDKTTKFEQAWEDMEDRLKLKSRFARLDKLVGIGHYGVLLMGFNDVQRKEDWMKPVMKSGGLKLVYIKPMSEVNAKISDWVKNTADPRFGLPLMYDVTISEPGESNRTMVIRTHYSRVLHVVDEPMENETEGTPRLEAVFNRLKDLEKLVGGSAEMFWRGARPGYSGKVDDEFELSAADEEKMEERVAEYENDLRRMFIQKGVNLEALTTQVSDPIGHVDVQIMMISAVTGIPKRVLTGTERGELASTQDTEQWLTLIQSRREEFAEPAIVRPFVDRCIELGVLPQPTENKEGKKVQRYSITWEDLYAPSEKDKVEVGKARATALKEYASQPMATEVVPPAAFFEFFLGLSPDQIELIKEMQDAAALENDNDFEEEEEEEEINNEPEIEE